MTREYLESMLGKAKEHLPKWLFNELHNAAVPEAGAKARWKTDEPTLLEKVALTEIRPEVLRKLPDEEIRLAWLRLHQWYANAKQRKQPVEEFVNAAIFAMQEMQRRDMSFERESDLAQEAAKLAEASGGLMQRLNRLPNEVVMVRDFVSVVGSNAAGKGNPNDLDILLRTKTDDNNSYIIQAENVWLPLRKILDPNKDEILHWVYNEAGPHSDFISLYDLVLRKRPQIKAEIVKGEEWIEKDQDGVMVGFWLPEELAKAIAIEGGEKAEELHMTVTYHGKISELGIDKHDILNVVRKFANEVGEVAGYISGIGRFNGGDTSEGQDVVYASFDGPALPEFRQRLADHLEKGGIPTKKNHGYTPHITLAYVDKGKASPIEKIDTHELTFKEITVAIGDEQFRIPLKGAVIKEEVDVVQVPSVGEAGAKIAFVGASPGAVEFARGEPFVGPAGETFRDLYLEPLGMRREDVFLTNAVPIHLRDEDGKVREPKASEVQHWHGWLIGELEMANPKFIIALGQTAKEALGELADFVMPHPAAVRRFGNSGEIDRKIRQIKAAMHMVKKASTQVETLVENSYIKALRAFGDTPDGSHTIKELIPDKLFMVKDGWGERYFLLQGEKALYVASKYADVRAYNFKAPMDRSFSRDDVKRMGWGDQAWNNAIIDWVKAHHEVKKQEKLSPGQDEPERAEVATKFWNNNWQTMFPPDGKGRFVYQHHWRGLSEEEARKLDDKQLLATSHSVHGDWRLESDGSLWGISVFLGTTEANIAGGDRLFTLPQDDNLQVAFKLAQPKAWFGIAGKEPFVVEPGGVGATSQKWSKFFELDKGTYEIGVWRKHSFEIFADGDDLKGRYLIQFAPVRAGQRVWLIDKPKDQTPIAENRSLASEISELKGKGQKFLIWGKPGKKPIAIQISGTPQEGFISADDILSAMAEADKKDPWEIIRKVRIVGKIIRSRVKKEYQAEILKADDEKQIVTGIVLEPDTVDTQGDKISAEEIEKAAHFYLVKSRTVGEQHKRPAKAEIVESYIAPEDFTLGDQAVKKGSWVVSVRVLDDAMWKGVKSGAFTGFSVGGFGIRE